MQRGFGVIYKVRRKWDNAIFVLKEIEIGEEGNLRIAQQEMQLLKTIVHGNIVRYVDSFLKNSKFYIVMEFCEKGDLNEYLNRLGPHFEVPEWRVWKFFIQICLALECIHKQGVIHSDLKPQNILLAGRDYDIRLADFGISQVLSKNYQFVHQFVGTLYYCSPEICKGQPFGQKADVWALGCVLYEICTKRKAFEGTSEENMKLKIVNSSSPQIPIDKYSQNLAYICSQCLIKNPEERPSIDQLLSQECVIEEAAKLNIDIGRRQTILLYLRNEYNIMNSKQKSTQDNVLKPLTEYITESTIDHLQEHEQIDRKIQSKGSTNMIISQNKDRRQAIINNVQQLYFSKQQSNQEFYKDMIRKKLKRESTATRLSPILQPQQPLSANPPQTQGQQQLKNIDINQDQTQVIEGRFRNNSKASENQSKTRIQQLIIHNYQQRRQQSNINSTKLQQQIDQNNQGQVNQTGKKNLSSTKLQIDIEERKINNVSPSNFETMKHQIQKNTELPQIDSNYKYKNQKFRDKKPLLQNTSKIREFSGVSSENNSPNKHNKNLAYSRGQFFQM